MNKGIRELGMRERKVYLLLGSLLFAAIAAGFTYIKPLNDIDYLVSDRIYQSLIKKNQENSNIKLISIDEKTREKYGEYATWSRSRLASLLHTLNMGESTPNVIGINLDLQNEMDTPGDADLLKACRKYSNICLSGTVMTEAEKGAVPEKIPSPAEITQFPKGKPSPNKSQTGSTSSASLPPDYLDERKIVEINLPYPALLPEASTGTSYNSKIRSLVDSALLILLDIILCVLLNYAGFYIPLLQLILIIILIAVSNLFLSYLISKRQRRELVKAFKKYVDRKIVDDIVNNGPETASIGVVRKDISVLFIDIRGFTSLSESLPPEQIADILNNYLTVIANAVAKNGGTLDKFIGDAAMAVFNSPFDLDDYVYKSVCTAWDILSNAAWLTRLCQKKYGKEIAFGIGIHCGDAVVGNIGSPSRMDFTAIGDTVNTASRLESSAAKGQILISREIRKRLGDRIETKYSGRYALKGKKLPMDAYELKDIIDYSGMAEETAPAENKWTAASLEELKILENIAEKSTKHLGRLAAQIEQRKKKETS